jgi:hypothetical protein
MEEKKIKTFTYDDLIKEHEKLVAALKSGDTEKIKEEADEQEKELAQYKKEYEDLLNADKKESLTTSNTGSLMVKQISKNKNRNKIRKVIKSMGFEFGKK